MHYFLFFFVYLFRVCWIVFFVCECVCVTISFTHISGIETASCVFLVMPGLAFNSVASMTLGQNTSFLTHSHPMCPLANGRRKKARIKKCSIFDSNTCNFSLFPPRTPITCPICRFTVTMVWTLSSHTLLAEHHIPEVCDKSATVMAVMAVMTSLMGS